MNCRIELSGGRPMAGIQLERLYSLRIQSKFPHQRAVPAQGEMKATYRTSLQPILQIFQPHTIQPRTFKEALLGYLYLLEMPMLRQVRRSLRRRIRK